MPPRLAAAHTMALHSSHPQRDTCSSSRAASFTEVCRARICRMSRRPLKPPPARQLGVPGAAAAVFRAAASPVYGCRRVWLRVAGSVARARKGSLVLLDATVVRAILLPASMNCWATGTGTCRAGSNGCRGWATKHHRRRSRPRRPSRGCRSTSDDGRRSGDAGALDGRDSRGVIPARSEAVH